MKQLFVTSALLMALTTVSPAAPETRSAHMEPDAVTCALLEQLMDSIEENDYQSFVANGDANFKAAITKDIFDKVEVQLEARVKAGYSATYVTQINRSGYIVSLWKIHFEDGGDEMLANLSLKNGKIGGFLLS